MSCTLVGHAGPGDAAPVAGGVLASEIGLHCDHSTNDTLALRGAVEAGGRAAGRVLRLPSGCVVLLGSPGAGDAVAEVASGTTIHCEDTSAGFVLGRRFCDDASDTPGAACVSDEQCTNGRCVSDDPGGPFAPEEQGTYTVLAAAPGARDVTLRNCSIWASGGSGGPPVMGGSGKRWGYCAGGGTSIVGSGCFRSCNVPRALSTVLRATRTRSVDRSRSGDA